MTISVAVVISGIGCAFAIYFGLSNNKRNLKTDTAKDVSTMTTVLIGLESIKDLIKEVKQNMTNIEKDVREQGNNQIRMEEAFRSIVDRIKNLEDRKG